MTIQINSDLILLRDIRPSAFPKGHLIRLMRAERWGFGSGWGESFMGRLIKIMPLLWL